MIRHHAPIHSNPPVTIPTRYPSPAIPTTCSAEMFDASRDIPMKGHLRSRPARKYSVSDCLFPAARSTAAITRPRLARMMTESAIPSILRMIFVSEARYSVAMRESIRAAAIALNSQAGDLQGNLERISKAASRAAAAGAELVLFPELSMTGFIPNHPAGDHAQWLREALHAARAFAQPPEGQA